jgi:hypothetical protein
MHVRALRFATSRTYGGLALSVFVVGVFLGSSALADATRTERRVQVPSTPKVVRTLGALARTDAAAYRKLTWLCDRIGHRLTGSPQLEQAVQWAVGALSADGHENVRAEPVTARKWVRGDEALTLLAPRVQRLPLLGLGNGVGTPAGGVTADVEVVRTEAELDTLGERARGRIILFDLAMPAWTAERGSGYGEAVRFRVHGPRLAAEKGAVGVLVRSVTARSLRTPHTGVTVHADSGTPVPGASVTTEDAGWIARLRAAGERVQVRLELGARDAGEVQSANVVAELVGRERPEEFVVIGGHLDSWDVGQGAHDDGAGVVMAMQALTWLRSLGVRPRRTIRVVLWTNEENGLAGGTAYARDHAAELPGHVAALEADMGGFRPRGVGLVLQDLAAQARAERTLRALAPAMRPLDAHRIFPGFGGADLGPMLPAGVPAMGLRVDDSTYFDYHHTEADTLDKVDPAALAASTAALAAWAWVLAEHPDRLNPPAAP